MVFLIFPHQLFTNLSHLKSLKPNEPIYLIEEPRYFTDFKFHKLKLAYHRASMKKYMDMLVKKGYNVKYINFNNVTKLFYLSLKSKFNVITIINPGDFKLFQKLENIFKKSLQVLENKNFLIKTNELEQIKNLIYKNKRYSHDEFYKFQREKLSILMDSNNKPTGGKWSYDSENRQRLPKTHTVPETISKTSATNKYIKEAIEYVNSNFPNNYGLLSVDNFIYPIDNSGSKKWLDKFLKERLGNFGPYEDSVSKSEPFVYHSVLSPMMNIGLITDEQVVKISYDYYLANKKNIPIQSFEGFIRQVIGWRNYVYTIYLLEGPTLYESNQLKHHNKINDKFWTGQTGIEPVDNIIQKLVKYAYAHHIERLMYLGNFMLVCQIDPKEVYRIFMEWSIDSYDWVMVPNVFGMSQYASAMMMTRPYFSSSNYIIKMSDYKKDGNWDKIWDGLYYNFINKHESLFKKNYAIAYQVKHWNDKTESEQKQLISIANGFLKKLFS